LGGRSPTKAFVPREAAHPPGFSRNATGLLRQGLFFLEISFVYWYNSSTPR